MNDNNGINKGVVGRDQEEWWWWRGEVMDSKDIEVELSDMQPGDGFLANDDLVDSNLVDFSLLIPEN
jgi:hypothetical protein